MNSLWSKYIVASINKHFDTNRQSIKLFIEGSHRDTRETDCFMELRVDGPSFEELSNSCWRISVTINVLVQSQVSSSNMYDIQTVVGIAQAAFTNALNIYKYGGTGVNYDGSSLLCMQLTGPIKTINFGKVDVEVEVMQSTVESTYVGQLIL